MALASPAPSSYQAPSAPLGSALDAGLGGCSGKALPTAAVAAPDAGVTELHSLCEARSADAAIVVQYSIRRSDTAHELSPGKAGACIPEATLPGAALSAPPAASDPVLLSDIAPTVSQTPPPPFDQSPASAGGCSQGCAAVACLPDTVPLGEPLPTAATTAGTRAQPPSVPSNADVFASLPSLPSVHPAADSPVRPGQATFICLLLLGTQQGLQPLRP